MSNFKVTGCMVNDCSALNSFCLAAFYQPFQFLLFPDNSGPLTGTGVPAIAALVLGLSILLVLLCLLLRLFSSASLVRTRRFADAGDDAYVAAPTDPEDGTAARGEYQLRSSSGSSSRHPVIMLQGEQGEVLLC